MIVGELTKFMYSFALHLNILVLMIIFLSFQTQLLHVVDFILEDKKFPDRYCNYDDRENSQPLRNKQVFNQSPMTS